ncbi:MAG: PIG-L family deacetylase [Gemmatimonadota bacterium]
MIGLPFVPPRTLRPVVLAAVAALLFGPPVLPGQERGAAALGPLVEGLGVSARVLFIAAHPDDEDTQLITWLAKGRHVETAYLALTRGDGGQNLIGNELGESLGAIRTEELLAARRLDGGRQYFTRAYDFGFSKNAEETLTQWSRDSILRDVITVVRQFRPHVIIAVFSGTPADGHGHHQVSGIFAREAYDVAGDTIRFPRSTTAGYGPWTVDKFYRGANFRMQDQATLRMNVGEYDPILGRSYSEIASDSRSQHKSQAMGSLQLRGVRYDQVIREASRAARAPADPKKETGLLDGIDTTWSRFASVMRTPSQRAALDSLPSAFAQARTTLDLAHPGRTLPALVRVSRLLRALCPPPAHSPCFDFAAAERNPVMRSTLEAAPLSDDVRQVAAVQGDLAEAYSIALARTDKAIVLASGVVVEATASREVWALHEGIPVAVRVFNRGDRPIALARATVLDGAVEPPGVAAAAPLTPITILPDSSRIDSVRVTLDAPSQPWWLATPRVGAMFTPRTLGISETGRRASATVAVAVRVEGGSVQTIEAPVVFRYADAIRGEIRHPIAGAPAITVSLDDAVAYAQANTQLQRAIRVYVRSHASGPRDVTVRLQLPAGLLSDSAERHVHFAGNADVRAASGPGAAFGIGGGAAPELMEAVTFVVRGRLAPGRHVIAAVATSGGETFTTGYTQVQYDHIRPQRLYRPATLGLEAVDVTLPRALTIAYIAGVGDNVAPMLEQLGVNVTVVDPAALPRTDLSKFGAVVVGTRAYEASDALVANNARLLDYARAGGTLVVQYGQYEMTRPGIMPFPITLSRPADRVTVEGAPVEVIDPSAGILASPNTITASDFDGWIQDRTLYMPHTFDPAYKPVFETHDPGEAPNRGAVLVASYGKGTYVYTTLAFFRQLPNGNPGAARLMVNLLSARTAIVP